MVPGLLVGTAAHICRRCFLRVGSPAIVSARSICGMAHCARQVWPAAFLRLRETPPSCLACHIHHAYLPAGFGWTSPISVSDLALLEVVLTIDKEKGFEIRVMNPSPFFPSFPIRLAFTFQRRR